MNNLTVGVFGGGQLGRMLAQAALPLGINCIFLEDAENCPASSLGKVYKTKDIAAFKAAADVFTLEFENTDAQEIAVINEGDHVQSVADKRCFPSEQVLSVAQDRLKEKNTFTELGIKTVPFLAVSSQQELGEAAQKLGLPLVLKTTRGGYDGKGQFVLRTEADIETAWQALGEASPLIAEGFINFQREVSIIAVRSQTGDIKTYPLVENHHHNGILSHSFAPAPELANNPQLTQQATQAVTKLLEHFNYVGVLTLELFVTAEGILANEIAPRVHNSGHWSIEGAVCSQFENHMRAVAGLPLGSTDTVSSSMMVNIVGQYPKLDELLAIQNVHVHSYHKTEREDRKIGHITVMPVTKDTVQKAALQLAEILPNKMGL